MIINFVFLVLESIVLDPRIAAWLLDPAESNPTFEDLVKKYCDKTDARNTESPSDTQVCIFSMLPEVNWTII